MGKFEITGKLSHILKEKGAREYNGRKFYSQEFGIEEAVTKQDGGEFKQIVSFEIGGADDYGRKAIDNFAKYNKIGDEVKVTFEPKSNYYVSKSTGEPGFFLKLTASRVDKVGSAPKATANGSGEFDAVGSFESAGAESDDLPF